MDSCHIFNVLFGAKKATSELSRCLSALGENAVRKSRKSEGKRGPSDRSPPSPLKQLQRRIASLSPGGKKQAEPPEVPTRKCNQVDCVTYRATLVETIDPDEEPLDEAEENGKTNQSAQRPEVSTKPLDENRSGPSSEPFRSGFVSQMEPTVGINTGTEDREQERFAQEGHQDPNGQTIISDKHNKRVVLYADYEPHQQDQPLVSSAEVYNIVSEFGEARVKLKRVGSLWDDNQTGREREVGEKKRVVADDSGARPASPERSDKSCESSNDKRSAYVRSLVQSFESNGGFFDPANGGQRHCNSKCRPPDEQQQQSQNNNGFKKPVTIVKPLPPKTPPKTNRARCLNMQLSLNKPAKIQQLFQDEKFLNRFFDKLAPLDRCVAAQVCRLWRNILYANQNYWKDLVNVIDCTQLRREHLVECIINTLQTAKLKQLRSGELRESTAARYSNRHNAPASSSYGQARKEANEFIPSSQGSRFTWSSQAVDLQQQQLDSSSLFETAAGTKLGSMDSMFDIDQEDVWRIQELCNRFTQRGSSRQQHNSMVDSPIVAGEQQPSKSSSIPSQISSTLSSVSLSSLLSPLSESSRIECIKEKLYTSLDYRGFDAICLFGATDDDIEELVNKIPASAHKRIVIGRLNNCCVTDRGLGLFIGTFSQIEELELSGCNEISNSFELRALPNLKRLIITDCINIADGLAQRLCQIVGQLDELTIQAYHLTDAFLEFLGANSDTTKLKRLELPNCKEISNQSLLTMAKHLPQLEALSISGSTKISDDGIEILAEQARQLVRLDLSWCSRITDASLECIACDLGDTLTDLTLDRNVHITDIGLGYLATMNKLASLHIRWCPRITDIGLESIIATLKSLRYLSLAGIHQITARSLLCLVDTELLELELTNCPSVNTDLLTFLSTRLPNCNIIF